MNLPVLETSSTIFFLCDMQEKFKNAIFCFEQISVNAEKLLKCGKILDVPLIVTEQYPKGLGHTISSLDISHAIGVLPKTKFSMIIPEVEKLLESRKGVTSVVLMGLEAHVCIEQTALDLLAKGIKVHIVADATSSRSEEDRNLALNRLQQCGCFITTSEAVVFKLVKDKDHPKFNEIRQLVKEKSLKIQSTA